MNTFLLLHLFLNLVNVIFLIISISDSLTIDQMGFFIGMTCLSFSMLMLYAI